MSELEELRRRIDDLDGRLVRLLAERLGVAAAIGAAKEAAGLSFYDPLREQRVLDRVVEEAAEGFPPDKLRSIFREIISASRSQESALGVLVHGVWGGLAHYAASRRFGLSAPLHVTSREEDIFARLEDGTFAHAVISLEGHSLEASLDRLDLFFHSEIGIFGEFYVRPRLGLYRASAQTGPAVVYGTPSAFVQAARWIERQAGEREFRAVGTSREAVRLARETAGGVLGHPVLGSLEGLAALEEGIEDLPERSRRFLVLSQTRAQATGKDKTSLLAVIANRPGALHRVTGILSAGGINLCWLEPKATHLGTWDHIFVLEIEGHQDQPEVAEALRQLRQELALLRVLGSYPSEKPPERPF